MNRSGRALLAGGAVTAEAYAALQWLGRTYGSTLAERRMAMPGDEIVQDPQITVTHAVSIEAPPDEVWPWLVQMGWHRAGWYTARWVDRWLFPDNEPSATTILEELQDLQVGDFIPDGAPETECGFDVVQLERNRVLALHSTTHLPLSWRTKGIASVDWTWSFALRPERFGRTRLVFRWRSRTSPWWLTLGAKALIVPADFVMSRSMLQGIRQRVSGNPKVPHPKGLLVRQA